MDELELTKKDLTQKYYWFSVMRREFCVTSKHEMLLHYRNVSVYDFYDNFAQYIKRNYSYLSHLKQ